MTLNCLESGLNPYQNNQLAELEHLALRLNQRLNLYSEQSAQQFHERHILHSLLLATRPFPATTDVVDWGTGGGMPGLPLAIAFPDTTFHLVDSVGKKIKAVETMVRRLKLPNVRLYHSRAQDWKGQANYSVSRATAPLVTLWEWHNLHYSPIPPLSNFWKPGLVCLKGGDLKREIAALEDTYPDTVVAQHPIQPLLDTPYFEDKVIISVTRMPSD